MFYTDIIQSEIDHSFYIGYTGDIKSRLEKHNTGNSRYTSKKIPWKLVYYEKFQTKSEAIKREFFLKKQKNKAFYHNLIDNFSLE